MSSSHAAAPRTTTNLSYAQALHAAYGSPQVPPRSAVSASIPNSASTSANASIHNQSLSPLPISSRSAILNSRTSSSSVSDTAAMSALASLTPADLQVRIERALRNSARLRAAARSEPSPLSVRQRGECARLADSPHYNTKGELIVEVPSGMLGRGQERAVGSGSLEAPGGFTRSIVHQGAAIRRSARHNQHTSEERTKKYDNGEPSNGVTKRHMIVNLDGADDNRPLSPRNVPSNSCPEPALPSGLSNSKASPRPAALAREALLSAPHHRLRLSDIYNFITAAYPGYVAEASVRSSRGWMCDVKRALERGVSAGFARVEVGGEEFWRLVEQVEEVSGKVGNATFLRTRAQRSEVGANGKDAGTKDLGRHKSDGQRKVAEPGVAPTDFGAKFLAAFREQSAESITPSSGSGGSAPPLRGCETEGCSNTVSPDVPWPRCTNCSLMRWKARRGPLPTPPTPTPVSLPTPMSKQRQRQKFNLKPKPKHRGYDDVRGWDSELSELTSESEDEDEQVMVLHDTITVDAEVKDARVVTLAEVSLEILQCTISILIIVTRRNRLTRIRFLQLLLYLCYCLQ
jgi:hypothetical protein